MAESSKKKVADKPKTKKVVKKVVDEPEVILEAVEEVQVTEEIPEDTAQTDLENTAKAGKRSAKSLKQVEEKLAKEERKAVKAVDEDESKKPKPIQKPPRTKVERKGKHYRELINLIDKQKLYDLASAIGLAIETSPTKFDSTVELHVRLGVDPKQADQNIRDNVVLPSGSGKVIKVTVYGDDSAISAAKKAGADSALGDELLQQLEKGTTDFDILITTPSMMPKLGKFARMLGPKGLMPNPKNGSVTNDIGKAVSEAKAGKVEYRIDSTGIVHLGIGKVSFGLAKLQANAETVLSSIKSNKPNSLKGNYINSIYVTTSMGPSIQIDRNI